MSPRTLSTAALSALVLTATLSGCGSSGSDVPSLEAGTGYDPATGPTVKGDGYTLHTVSGWRDVTSTAKQRQSQIDKAYAAVQPVDGFAPNVNVIVMSGAGDGEPTEADFDKSEKQAVSELKGVGATDIKVQPRLDLDDETALHVTATATSGSLSYRTDQYFAYHGGKGYVITYSVPASLQESQSNALTKPSIASLRWS